MFQQFNGVQEYKYKYKTVIQDKYFLPHQPLKNITQPPLRSRPEPTYTLPEVTLKREYKICGQIGESGQKDKLSYFSLDRIVEALIRVVSRGLPLKDMLEIKS